MSMQKIDPPKITEVIAEIKIKYVKVEGQDEPMVILENTGKHPAELAEMMITASLMIITQVRRSITNGN